MSVYRWDKRQTRKDKRNSRHSLDVFDIILLNFIFVIGVVLFKFLMIYAIITMPCADYVANFGAGIASPPAFKAMFYISILMFGFWLTLVILEPSRRNSLPRKIWQSTFLICILLMVYSAYHLSIWDKSAPPDGTLGVADGVWGMRSGKKTWSNIPLNTVVYEFINGGVGSQQEFRIQRCVWLDAGLISVGKDFMVDDLDLFLQKVSEQITPSTYELERSLIDPYKETLSSRLQFFLSSKSHLQILRDNQEHLRPLTDAERARFLTKQHCIEKQIYDPSGGTHSRPFSEIIEKCDPQSYPPMYKTGNN